MCLACLLRCLLGRVCWLVLLPRTASCFSSFCCCCAPGTKSFQTNHGHRERGFLTIPALPLRPAWLSLYQQINGAENLQSLLERGALCRTTASTNMNAHSSRSHAICTLSFQMVRPATETADETATSSLFHLVDLAGSERAKKTGAEVCITRPGEGGRGGYS